MDINDNPRFMLCVLFMCFSMKFHVSSGADTISANQTLSGDQTIVSTGEVFVLGFFKPGNSSNYYIGMWYKQISEKTIVWVANREQPVYDRFSSVLKISNGNLVLFNEYNTPIWSTNLTSTTSNSVVAVLRDDGNLVLGDGSNLLTPLWQSFDHPTHTLLPGNKLAFDKKTNKSTLLTSWKNKEDPAPGLFSLQLDPSTQYLLLWNRSQQYWTSGPWDNESEIFSLIPEMRTNYIFNYTFVSNENESYLFYTTYPNSPISRFIMDYSGQIRQLNWLSLRQWFLFWSQPRTQCEVYAFCGPFSRCVEQTQPFGSPKPFGFCDCLMGFEPKSQKEWDVEDFSGGCMKHTNMQCANGYTKSDRFLAYPNMALPDNPQTVSVGSVTECESTCLNNCSCTSYAYDNGGCSIWIGDNLLNLQQLADGSSSGKTIHIRLADSEFPSPSNNNNKAKVIGIVVGSVGVALLLLGLVAFLIMRQRKRTIRTTKVEGSLVALHLHDTERRIKDFIDSSQFKEEDKKGIDVPFFDLESILAATDNFSDAKKLGKGGFGPVYKGNFPGGQEIAVKRLSSVSGQGLEEFKNEVVLIAKLQHRNLVRLLGYCIQGDEKILLYEYMPNKSLDSFIFDDKHRVLLDWEMRFNIILGIARGLLYLHQDSRLRIIHRDLKTSNVLLDGEMNPKISDFGLARIFGGKQTEGTTNRVVGTYGYMSPEYALDGFFSVKSDVFSFGVVILEIISGRRNTGFYNSEQALSLLGYAWRLWREDKALDLMDQTLRESCNVNEFLKCINLGLLCVQEDPNDRPTMSNVIVMLGSEIATVPTPKRPAFVVRRALSSTAPSNRPVTNTELTSSLDGR